MPRAVAVVVRGHKVLGDRAPPRRPRVRRAAGRRHRAGRVGGRGGGPGAGRGVLAGGHRGAAPLRRRPRRPLRVVLPGRRARGRAGARRHPRPRSSGPENPYQPLWATAPASCRCCRCFRRGSSDSGRGRGLAADASTAARRRRRGPCSRRCGSSTSTTSRSSGTRAPGPGRPLPAARLAVVRRAVRPDRLPRQARRGAVRLRAGARARRRPDPSDGRVLRDAGRRAAAASPPSSRGGS